MFERENYEIMKAIISIVLSKDKEAYMIKEAAGYGNGKRGKNLFFFFKTALCCRFEPLVYFTFWIIPRASEFSL